MPVSVNIFLATLQLQKCVTCRGRITVSVRFFGPPYRRRRSRRRTRQINECYTITKPSPSLDALMCRLPVHIFSQSLLDQRVKVCNVQSRNASVCQFLGHPAVAEVFNVWSYKTGVCHITTSKSSVSQCWTCFSLTAMTGRDGVLLLSAFWIFDLLYFFYCLIFYCFLGWFTSFDTFSFWIT